MGYGLLTQEVEITDPTSGVSIKGARVYGFKNIQNLIRQIKTSTKNPYKYIELMACPGGCYNGGGQVKGKEYNLEELNKGIETMAHAYCQKRYFFENQVASQIAGLILQEKFPLATKSSIEYQVKPLVTTDNPVFMKW